MSAAGGVRGCTGMGAGWSMALPFSDVDAAEERADFVGYGFGGVRGFLAEAADVADEAAYPDVEVVDGGVLGGDPGTLPLGLSLLPLDPALKALDGFALLVGDRDEIIPAFLAGCSPGSEGGPDAACCSGQ